MAGAKLGEPDSLCEMGGCFFFGYGTGKNEAKVFEYCMKAANLRHARGYFETGACFESGIATELDYARASKYFKAAAEGGDVRGLTNYGYICYVAEESNKICKL